MAFISASNELVNKSFTYVENKFITKYLPMLEPVAVKVYLLALYSCQHGQFADTLEEFSQKLTLSEEQVKSYFEYLEEFELIAINSLSPFEIKILDPENIYGSPKKFKPEKYADFTKNVQNIIKGRMISTNEFREYFLLLEEYGFEQNALIMIINYCVNLKGDGIRLQYIKKVAKSFADEGITTTKKVDEKLSAYTYSTPALIRIFKATGINKQPDIDDDKLYKKWTCELGFEEDSIICAAKCFKVKNCDKLDFALEELFRNKKFDVKEITEYAENKALIYDATLEVAKSLGVYMHNSAPYIENYMNIWCDYGFTLDSLKHLANYCFKNNKKSFEDMHEFVQKLYNEGIVSDESINEYINKLNKQDEFLQKLLSVCGLTRKVIVWDRESLSRWKSWGFTEEMILEAAKLSEGKLNPMAYINGILSSWKSESIFSPDKIINQTFKKEQEKDNKNTQRADIERHYSELRHKAEDKAELNLKRALSDDVYNKIHKDINELSIQLAFAEIRNSDTKALSDKMHNLEVIGKNRLSELGISSSDLTPDYSCKLCNDTGYDKNGKACQCLKVFLNSLK